MDDYDALTREIAYFALEFAFDRSPEDVRAGARTRLVDSVGCAVGGVTSEPAVMAGRLAPRVESSAPTGRIVGRRAADVSLDTAAFVNTVAVRYLDFNDGHMPGSHPSDVVGALLAVAEHCSASGREVLAALTISYEVAIRFSAHTPLRAHGWDQGFSLGMGATAAVGRLLRLDEGQLANALSIFATSAAPLRVARTGSLSTWKGAATAAAARHAVFCCLLAEQGMTGPPNVFSGRDGVWQVMTGEFELPPFPTAGGEYLLMETGLKALPVCYHIQGAAWAALEARRTVPYEEVASIEVGLYGDAWRETASERDKWAPTTRETADHSLPYVVAKAYRDGELDLAAFEPDAFLDPSLRPFMARVEASVDAELDAAFPASSRTTMRIVDRAGVHHVVELGDPPGHANNPLTRERVEAKFHALVAGAIGESRAADAFTFWWQVEEAPDLRRGLDGLSTP